MLSFTNLLTEAQEQAQDTSSDSQTFLVAGINQGLHKFRAAMRREYTNESTSFTLTSGQQYYPLPADAVRPDRVTITVGDIDYPLEEVASNRDWRYLNSRNNRQSDIPEFFYVRGHEEFGIWPTPSTTAVNAGTLEYQARKHDLSVADYATGTISVTNGDETITGLGTTFTAAMVGRYLRVNDNSENQIWYKIASFTSTTSIELEKVYGGVTGSGLSYIIGEVPDIPEEFHLNLVDHAMWRYYLRRKDRQLAADFKSNFEQAIFKARRDYSSKTRSNYISGRRKRVFNNIFTREPREVS